VWIDLCVSTSEQISDQRAKGLLLLGVGADRKIVARDKGQAVYPLLNRFGQPLNRFGLNWDTLFRFGT